MDTRRKILTLEKALRLAGPLAIAAGTFEVLRAEHARELGEIRMRAGSVSLLVVVLPTEADIVPARGRAEMVAGLRVVDYVVSADAEDMERLSRAHGTAAVVRLDAADRRRIEQLIEHVRRRQSP